MPDPRRILDAVTRAALLFRAAPGRHGLIVDLDEHADDVLVAGDLHGNLAHFQALLDSARLDSNPGRHLVLQELVHGAGRYPEGGCRSHQLVDLVAALKCQYPGRVHLILGNHELAELLGKRILKGGVSVNELFRSGVDTAYGARGDEVYAAYLELFRSLPLAVRARNGVFVCHSLPEATTLDAGFDGSVFTARSVADVPQGRGSALYAVVWGRDTAEQTAQRFARLVGAQLLVTGHIPCQKGFDTPNSIQLVLDSSRFPACYCLFPNRDPQTLAGLVACVHSL